MQFGQAGLTITVSTRRDICQEALDQASMALFALFQARETEFGFNSNIVVEYPDISDIGQSAFLLDPAGYANARVAALNSDGDPISHIVILTTFGDRLRGSLFSAGYHGSNIDMPAGPDGTAWFERKQADNCAKQRTLYLEAVDEADEKIKPSFVIELRDKEGRLRGGGCGAIHERGGLRFCYLATMTLDTGLPKGTGTALGEILIDVLRAEGVIAIHLGTQTAGPFYEKLGFRVTHRLVHNLRTRAVTNGAQVQTDLVMMERKV